MAQILIEQVQAELNRRKIEGSVRAVEVAVGLLSGVVPEALEFAFSALIAGSVLEGARLVIRQVPALCTCQTCQQQTPIQDLAWVCPVCGSQEIVVKGGHELRLEAIEIVDERATPSDGSAVGQ